MIASGGGDKSRIARMVTYMSRTGYDDEETVELKRRFANDQCFGGSMAWSVDFNSGPGDVTEPPKSEDGSCGLGNGFSACPERCFGDCCSSSGPCGSSDSHCGSAYISHDFQEGGVTTDGRCGAGFQRSHLRGLGASNVPAALLTGTVEVLTLIAAKAAKAVVVEMAATKNNDDDHDDDDESEGPYDPDPDDDKPLADCLDYMILRHLTQSFFSRA
ncbi:hypothetical protein F4778DRAFT_708908 [Xylariomycetidae sp. FL2044]|nr:hypothetical protein F4778DRAFT_708908 [Xylariomycetidae sp. FL2044]